jgi:hypothetical protein
MCVASARRREGWLQDSSLRNASFFFIFMWSFFYIVMAPAFFFIIFMQSPPRS